MRKQMLSNLATMVVLYCTLSMAGTLAGQNTFTTETWRWDCGDTEVTIEFNQNVDPVAATNLANYTFSPQGTVTGITHNAPSSVVVLTVSGLSTTGWNILTMSNLFSATGEPLDNDYTQIPIYCHDHPVPNAPPEIVCPGDLVVDCAPVGGSPQVLSVDVADADGDPLTVIWYLDGVAVQTDNYPAAAPPNLNTSTLSTTFPLGTTVVSVSVSDAMNIASCRFEVTVNAAHNWAVICPLDPQEIFGADCPAITPDVMVLVQIEEGQCWQQQPFVITQDPAVGTPLANGSHTIVVTIEGPDGVIQTCDVPIQVDCPVAPVDPCQNLVASIPLNTGVNPVDGTLYPFLSVDPMWTVVGDPDPGTTEPRPAFVIPQYPFGWLPAMPGSRWLNAYPTFSNTLNGTYELETTFCLAPDWSNAVLDIELRADDWAQVYLNGTLIGSTPNPSFNNVNPTAILETNQALFQTGTNVLTVHMVNSGGVAMGLNLTGTVSADGLSLEDPLCCNPGLSLSGQKFFDSNQNGVFDQGESVLAGWTIQASDGVTTYTTTTDSNGFYYFMNLAPGSYTITEVQQPGYTQTTPAGGSHSVTLTPGQSVAGLDFGNVRVEVFPNEPPRVECPGDVMINCAPSGGTTVTLTASFMDPDGDPLSYTWFIDGTVFTTGGVPAGGPPSSGTSTITPFLAPGVYTVTVTVNDGAAEDACSFTVTVIAGELPQLFCRNGGFLTLPAGDDCSAVLPQLPYGIIAGCTPISGLVVTQTPAAGTVLPIGIHWAFIEVFDPLTGQSVFCRFQIRVIDQTPPTVICPPLEPVLSCDAVIPDLTTDLFIEDNCDAMAQLDIVQSPAVGTPVGPGSHTITVTVTDSSGNAAQCTTILQVLPGVTLSEPLVLFNTGRNPDNTPLPNLAVDPHYILTTSASTNWPGPDAYASSPIHGDWIPNANSTASRWITPQENGNRRITSGQYIYTKTFVLPPNATGANITGRWLTDNSAELRLNGVATGYTKPPNGFSAWTNFILSSGFVPGTNTLEFVVNALPSSGGFDFYTGLRVELEGESYYCDLLCEPPSVMILPVFPQSTIAGGTATFTALAGGTPPLSFQWYFNGAPIPGQTGQSLTISPVIFANSGSYNVSVTNDCGEVMSRAKRLRVIRGWIYNGDKWGFRPPASMIGERGSRIDFVDPDEEQDMTTYTWTHFGLSSDFGIPGPSGVPVDVMRFVRVAYGNGYAISIDPDATQQSFAFDLHIPADQAGNWIPLLHFDSGIISEANVYLLPQIEAGGDAPGCPMIPIPVDQWSRIIVSVDFASSQLLAYVNGQLTLSCELPATDPAPSRALLFTNAGESLFMGYVAEIAWFTTLLTAFDAASLGTTSAAGLPVSDPNRSIPNLAIQRSGADLLVHWSGDGLGLEVSTDLDHWEPLPVVPEVDESAEVPSFELRLPASDNDGPWFIRGDAF